MLRQNPVRNPLCILLILLTNVVGVSVVFAESSESVNSLFVNPPREYSSGPLWVWNDLLTEEQIRSTLQDLAGQHVRQPFVHPRPGLMTPYLSEDWFRLWKVSLDEAEKQDMNIWIYDENSYPSGFAGGFVPDAMPESRGLGVDLKTEKAAPAWSDDIIAIYRRVEGGYANVTDEVKAGKKMPEARYYVAKLLRGGASPWFGGKTYVDLLRPGVTEKFLEITLGAYKRELGDQFGKRVPGAFTDEPHLRPAGGNHWTPDLPEAFEKRWGYSLLDHLPSLWHGQGAWQRVRHNYHQLLLELFIERWAEPYYEFCEAHNLDFTGHYWEHGWPGAGSAPDNMAMYAWHQRPAIDQLFNQYNEGVSAQFGNVRSCLELQSVANQMGCKRTLCEAYGGSGWDARFEDFKRIGDWLYVLGVNTLNQHLSHITIRGARKRDYPPSFSYHATWWDNYHVLADYFARLSLALSSGKQINEILVIEPTTTTWMYQSSLGKKRDAIGKAFQELVTNLAKGQVEFDIGCEDIIARNGSVESDRLVVGQRKYHTVVIPPLLENLNSTTMDLLETYLKNGGRVLCCAEEPPSLVDGAPSGRGKKAAKNEHWMTASSEDLLKLMFAEFMVQTKPDSKGILYHHRRQLDDGDLLFLVNTSITDPVSGTVKTVARGIEKLDLEAGNTGERYPFVEAKILGPVAAHIGVPLRAEVSGVSADFELPPCGSLLLFLSDKPLAAAKPSQDKPAPITSTGDMEIRRVAQNVLTLDYVDVTAGGERHESIPFYKAAEYAFRANGLDHNPWDHAVQFRDELIRKTFPDDSGFEAKYRFTIEETVPKELFIVIERTDLYTITCNGKPIEAAEGAWWLDRAFGKIDIAGVAKVGENDVTIVAQPFTMFHELESAYVIGDFDVAARDKGFAIVPGQPLEMGPWNKQGLPLYGDAVSYTQCFDVADAKQRCVVTLPDWYGSVARVNVNGKEAGYIYHRPFECDVTGQIVAGENVVEVVVYGTPKNMLGPHHGNPPLGFAGPRSFQSGPEQGPPPGAEYSTLEYGLFAPFELHCMLSSN